MVVHRKRCALFRKRRFRHFALVHMVAARRVRVQLLQQQKIRIQRLQPLEHAGNILDHGLLRTRARFRSSVHEERIIVAVRAESEVPGRNGIFLVHIRRAGRMLSHVQRELVLNARILNHQIRKIPRKRHRNRDHNDQQRLQNLLHHQQIFKSIVCASSISTRSRPCFSSSFITSLKRLKPIVRSSKFG